VLRGGIDDGVDGFVVQNPAEVASGLGPRAFGLLDDLPCLFEPFVVDIANPSDFDVRTLAEKTGQLGSAPPHTNHTNHHLIACGDRSASNSEANRCAQKRSTVHVGCSFLV
jgi:hypothetical protein